MTDLDRDILNEVEKVFCDVTRPSQFTIKDGDPASNEYERMWSSKTPQTLIFEDVFPENEYPYNELLPEGLAYYFPAITKIVLESEFNLETEEWCGIEFAVLILGKEPNYFFEFCSQEQRKVIGKLLKHLFESRGMNIRDEVDRSAFERVIRKWSI